MNLMILLLYMLRAGSPYIVNEILDDQRLVLTGPKYDGIYIYSIKKGTARKISNYNGFHISLSFDRKKMLVKDEGKVILLTDDGGEKVIVEEKGNIGFPVWYSEKLIAYPYEGCIKIIDTNGTLKNNIENVNSPYIDTNGDIFAFQERDEIYLIDRDGRKEKISVDGVCYGPSFSPDGKKLILNCISKGIYLYDIETRAISFVSPGNNPRWSPDSKKIVFNISEDDGENITSSDIYIYSIEDKKVSKITDTPALHEIKPIFSTDGKTIYFNTPDLEVGYIKINSKVKLIRVHDEK